VVGAGVFGCAVAFALAKQGRSVILLERCLKEPNRIVGELLQQGECLALQKLGLGECLDDIDAVKVVGCEVIHYGKGVNIPYPENKESKRPPSSAKLAPANQISQLSRPKLPTRLRVRTIHKS